MKLLNKNIGIFSALKWNTNNIKFFSSRTNKPKLNILPILFVMNSINKTNNNNLFTCITSYPHNMSLDILINYVIESSQLSSIVLIGDFPLEKKELKNNTQIIKLNLNDFKLLLSKNVRELNPDNFQNIMHKSVFILINYSWHDLCDILKNDNIHISGGHTSKRHILSSVQLRLAKICLQIGISDEFIINAFHIITLHM